MYDVRRPLAVDCEASGMSLKKAILSHKHAEHGVFAGRPIVAGSVEGYHYGSAVYSDFDRQSRWRS